MEGAGGEVMSHPEYLSHTTVTLSHWDSPADSRHRANYLCFVVITSHHLIITERTPGSLISWPLLKHKQFSSPGEILMF